MADIYPFRAWRYDVSQVGDLSDVTAPPYDVIDPDQQAELYHRHPCNCIRVILNREEPGDSDQGERYMRASDFLKHWQSEGVLMQERQDALYVYHQVFTWEGTTYVRKGFFGRVRLEEFGEGAIYPHEQTMPGPKADRLALINACKMNLSAIFGLYPDPQGLAQTALENAVATQTAVEATDDLGVVHRLWPLTDHAVISQVRDALRGQPIFIADGHHRYETALNYRNQLREQGELENDTAPANFVLMTLIGMNDPGLAILPTHRVVSGLPDLSMDELKDTLSAHFQLDAVGEGAAGAKKAWELMQDCGEQGIFGFGTARDKQWVVARLTDASPMQSLAPDQSEVWRGLGVSVLHRFVLDHLIGNRYPEAKRECRYLHELDATVSMLDKNACQLACLVMPAGLEHVRQIASHLEKMPPKSTFFFPKLLSGLVFNPIGQ